MKNFREYYATAVIYWLAINQGIDASFTAYFIIGREHLKLTEEATFGSVNYYSRAVGAIFLSYSIDCIGRKASWQILNIIGITGWSLITFSSSDTSMVLGRLLEGMAAAGQGLSLVYATEMCSKHRKNTFIAYRMIFITIGSNIPILVGYFYHWKTISGIALLISLLGCLNMFFIPESPHWYLLKNKKEEAARTMRWFSEDASLSEVEQDVNNTLEIKNPSKYGYFCNFSFLKIFIVSMVMYILRGGTGRLAILSHTEHIINTFRVTDTDNKKIVIIISILEFCISNVYIFLIEKVNLIKMYVYTSGLMFICILAIKGNDLILHHLSISSADVTVFFLCTYIIIDVTGFITCFTAILNENISAKSRGIIFNLGSCLLYIVSGAYSYILPYLLENVNIDYILLYVSLDILLLAFIGIFILPQVRETKSNKDDTGDIEQKLLIRTNESDSD